MKVIIAGSRGITDALHVVKALDGSGYVPTEIVSGGARGVDRLGEILAHGRGIPVKLFPADWDRLGKSAGFHRNNLMADYADALVAVWDGFSPGTRQMISAMRKRGKPYFPYVVQ